jgi:hypothetical protein
MILSFFSSTSCGIFTFKTEPLYFRSSSCVVSVVIVYTLPIFVDNSIIFVALLGNSALLKAEPCTSVVDMCTSYCHHVYFSTSIICCCFLHLGWNRTWSFTLLVPIESMMSTHSWNQQRRHELEPRLFHPAGDTSSDGMNLNRTVSPLYVALTVRAGLLLSLSGCAGFFLKVGWLDALPLEESVIPEVEG